MAKDDSNKLVSSNNNSDTANSAISDQQKVPPLRICLNTGGNQKSSPAGTPSVPPNLQQQPSQQQDLKREKLRDTKPDGAIKSGGRVRIRLSTNQQNNNKNTTYEQNFKPDESQKGTQDNSEQKDSSKEEVGASYSHLRRITRRSNRTAQTVSNEDEESMTSMTSTDEYQNIATASTNNTNNHNSDGNSAQDSLPSQQQNTSSTSCPSTSTTTTLTNATTSNSTSTSIQPETPRRKRRKGEVSESLSCDHENLFGLQNYKLPHQNSFELFKNIRKQVDKRLKSLNSIHPKTPYGFREYMLNRGSYLLDGNKLGNGTNLYTNDNGGMHTAPMGKYHALRYNRINYMVADRAKVPAVIPASSPLYNLFIEQEKERYRMRMQHTKEREKLTLAAEQEIMRVYNQAALTAANQNEPFSACTMLKHQEVYNYLDSDGALIQTREDAQQDQLSKPETGARTRRRQHEQISPPPTREGAEGTTNGVAENGAGKDDKTGKTDISVESVKIASSPKQTTKTATAPDKPTELETDQSAKKTAPEEVSTEDKDSTKSESASKADEVIMMDESDSDRKIAISETDPEAKKESDPKSSDIKTELEKNTNNDSEEPKEASKEDVAIKQEPIEDSKMEVEETKAPESGKSDDQEKKEATDEASKTSESSKSPAEDPKPVEDDSSSANPKSDSEESPTVTGEDGASVVKKDATNQEVAVDARSSTSKDEEGQVEPKEGAASLSDEEQKEYDKDVFLSQLQEIDDKWDKIRQEMLIRHRNEAESLHAIQKLEWEWKTKEIGACDVRATPIIDSALVPKLNIYSQDY